MRARLLAVLVFLTAVPMFASIRGTAMSRDGQPLAGAKVSAFALETSDAARTRLLSKTPERTPLASTTTDSKGVFVLDSPKDAVVGLQIEAKGYAPEGMLVERDDDTIVVALIAAPSKQGTITANGKPVAGATVAWEANGVELISTTDAAGHYSVPDPARWASRVVVLHPDFAMLAETVGPTRKAETNLSLDSGVAISGKAVRGTAAIAKAAVLVDSWPLATSGDDGSFSIAHAPRKWETLDARSGDLSASQVRGTAAVTLKLGPATVISGSVRDAKTQQPVAGADVMFVQPMGRGIRMNVASALADAAGSALTDAKGNFTAFVRPGVYQLVGSHPSYAITTMNVSAAAGQHIQKAVSATPRARVTGTVVDEQKRGIAAASVSIEQADSGPMRGMMRRLMPASAAFNAFSGPDGRFTARTANQGEVEVTATKKGMPEGKTTAFRLAAGERKSGIMITIPLGVTLTGRVLDRDRKPLSGVAVTAVEVEGGGGGGRPGGAMVRRIVLNFAPAPQDALLTGSDGTFSLRVKEGSYDLKFSREGFAAKTLHGEQVSPSSKPVEVTLEPGVEITGRVVRGGNGIEGVNLAAVDSDSRSMAVTSSDGRFVLSDLTPGSYMVAIGKPDDFIQQMRSMTAPSRDITIEISPGGRISGRVVDKATHQPVTAFQAGINPSRGGGMVIQMPPVVRNFTSDDGSFVLENVPTGPAQLVVSAPGFTTAHVPSITVEEGKTVADVEVGLETGVRLTGHVSGPDGGPVAGVGVRPDTGGGRIPGIPGDSAATTDANGDYSIEQLEAGDNKAFQFARNGYLPEHRTVTLSGHETRLDVQLSAGLTISGTVVTEGGVPVPDAEVMAMSAAAGAGGKSTRTDAGGGFTFDAIAPGHYTFNASKNGFADGTLRDFDVTSGGSPRVVLKAGGTLTGHVSGVASVDLSKVTVSARSASGSADATVDAGGNYRIDGAPTGTLRVSASLMRGIGDIRTTDVKSTDLAAGGSAQLDLVFNADTVIRGHITRNGVPAANSAIQFNPRGGSVQTRASGTTDDNGNYSVTGLSDSNYNVTVIDMQRLSPYSTTYSVQGSGNFDIDIRTTTLRGHVIDRGDSSPIGSARVQLRRKDSQSMFANLGAVSDDSGGFVIDGVSAGTYSISADKDGYGNVVKDVSVTDSGAQDVMLDLLRNDGVTLKVVDGRDGRTLSATVTVFDAQNRPVYESPRFGGGSDSQRIPLSAGQYRASVAANGYAPRTVSFVAPSAQTVALTPGGTLILRSKTAGMHRAVLIDASGSPYLRPFAVDPAFVIQVGETRLQNVAPGQYTLRILGANGAVVSTQTVVIVEGQEIGIDV